MDVAGTGVTAAKQVDDPFTRAGDYDLEHVYDRQRQHTVDSHYDEYLRNKNAENVGMNIINVMSDLHISHRDSSMIQVFTHDDVLLALHYLAIYHMMEPELEIKNYNQSLMQGMVKENIMLAMKL